MDGPGLRVKHPERSELSASPWRLFQRRRRPNSWLAWRKQASRIDPMQRSFLICNGRGVRRSPHWLSLGGRAR